jgi:hypothetical protein
MLKTATTHRCCSAQRSQGRLEPEPSQGSRSGLKRCCPAGARGRLESRMLTRQSQRRLLAFGMILIERSRGLMSLDLVLEQIKARRISRPSFDAAVLAGCTGRLCWCGGHKAVWCLTCSRNLAPGRAVVHYTPLCSWAPPLKKIGDEGRNVICSLSRGI